MYVYCRDCGWQQDDFWTWHWTVKFWRYRAFGYNPIQCVIDAVREWIRPKRVVIQKANGEVVIKFSWRILIEELFEILKRAVNMRWKTYDQFRRDPYKFCPICGSTRLSVD